MNEKKLLNQPAKESNKLFSISSFTRLKHLFLRIINYGVAREKDESKQKYIIMMNLISIVSCTGLFSTGIILIFMKENFQSFLHFIGGAVWLLPIYINRNGLKLSSRLIVVFYSAIVLLLCSCWFTHYSTLDNYFLIVAITCLFIFSPQEKKWLLICVSFCLLLFVVESTPLQEYLPAYNTLTGERLAITNIVLLGGQIILILLDVVSFVYLNTIRENHLLEKQKQLEDAQHKVQIQNEDLKTFSIAASHSMQTPIQVCTFFLGKITTTESIMANPELRKSIGLIDNGLAQIEQLVTGLFSYNHIINIENEVQEFDTYTEINKIRNAILPNFSTARITIEPVQHQLKTNVLLFSTILHNLITNGLKYNVSLVPEVEVEIKVIHGYSLIRVRDNGIGVPSRYLPRIFEAFKRIPMQAGMKPGNGLGLACSKRAADRIGAYLKCVKSGDSGSIFTLEIPINLK